MGNRAASLALALAFILVLAFAFAFGGGCGGPAESPDEVAARFWDAMREGNSTAARDASNAPSDVGLRALSERLVIDGVELGKTLRNESDAVVETRLRLDPADEPIGFGTRLVLAGEVWLVDAEATARELRRAEMGASFEAVQRSLRETTELLADEMERRALEASEALREALQNLERNLRDDESL